MVIVACGNRCQRYYGVTFGTKVRLARTLYLLTERRMTIAKTISHCQGKGSLTHNSRKFSAKNVDSSRSKDNVVFVQQPLADAYNEIFGAAVERYNAKQKRSDRKIASGYFDHVFKRSPAPYVIKSADKRKSFYEDVVQIGSMYDTGVGTADAAVAAECLTIYMNGFQERNLNFRVFNAVLHLDEATPHLHIDYIPVGHYKQGVDTQNGIAQALKEMGYGVGKDAISRWRESERAVLEEICKAHNIEIAAPEKSRGSLTVEQYKEYAELKEKADNQRQEVEHLDSEISSKNLILEWRKEAIERTEQDLDKLGLECIEKRGEVEQLESELAEKQTALEQTSAAVSENQELIKQAVEKVSALNDINRIQTKKTLFGGNVTVSKSDFDNVTALAKKQIAAESKENSLRARISTLEAQNQTLTAEKERLTAKNNELRQENGELQSVSGKIAIDKLRSERDNLQQKLDRVMEFIKSLGLFEKLQAFLNPNKKLHR